MAGKERRRPQGGAERPACHKPRGQGARGKQGEEGMGEVRCTEGTARTRTRRQRDKDPRAWERERGRTRGDAHTRGRARPEDGSRGGRQGGRVASRIALPRASQSSLTSFMRHDMSVKPRAGSRKRHGGTGTCGAIRRASRAMTPPVAQRGHAPVAPSTGPPAPVAVSVTQRGRAPAAPTGGPPAA